MYEYPKFDEYKKVSSFMNNFPKEIERKLTEALYHDPLLHQVYKSYQCYSKCVDPFQEKKFFMYLSYIALSMNQRHIKLLITTAEHSINPSIILQQGDQFFNKSLIEALLEKEKRGYWQKLFDAIRGR